jgi:hypothetical protein
MACLSLRISVLDPKPNETERKCGAASHWDCKIQREVISLRDACRLGCVQCKRRQYSRHSQENDQCLDLLSSLLLCRISLSLSCDSVLSVLDRCFLLDSPPPSFLLCLCLGGALDGSLECGLDGALEVAPDGNLDPGLEGSLVPTPDGGWDVS